jgi:hypothetical protein
MDAMAAYLPMLFSTSDTVVDFSLRLRIPTQRKLKNAITMKATTLLIANMEATTLLKEIKNN